ncbi:hypothetical protein ACFX1T_039408 [Malus domestica]
MGVGIGMGDKHVEEEIEAGIAVRGGNEELRGIGIGIGIRMEYVEKMISDDVVEICDHENRVFFFSVNEKGSEFRVGKSDRRELRNVFEMDFVWTGKSWREGFRHF